MPRGSGSSVRLRRHNGRNDAKRRKFDNPHRRASEFDAHGRQPNAAPCRAGLEPSARRSSGHGHGRRAHEPPPIERRRSRHHRWRRLLRSVLSRMASAIRDTASGSGSGSTILVRPLHGYSGYGYGSDTDTGLRRSPAAAAPTATIRTTTARTDPQTNDVGEGSHPAEGQAARREGLRGRLTSSAWSTSSTARSRS